MSTQEQSKIEELSNKVRTLVDKVSILERENRSLREKYRDALERLDEAEKDITTLLERYQSVVIEPGNVLADQIHQSLQSPFGNNDGEGFVIPTRKVSEDDRHG